MTLRPMAKLAVDHRDLVDDQHTARAPARARFRAEQPQESGGVLVPEADPGEGVDRRAADVGGRDAGRRRDEHRARVGVGAAAALQLGDDGTQQV